MKLILLTACLPFCALPLSQAEDLFAPPPKAHKIEVRDYPTSAAFLAATRSGEVPELLNNEDNPNFKELLGRSVAHILIYEYRVPTDSLSRGLERNRHTHLGYLLFHLTQHELYRRDVARDFRIYKDNLGFNEDPKLQEGADFFLKDYARAVREYSFLKLEHQGNHLSAEQEKQRQADRVEQKAQDEQRQAIAKEEERARAARMEKDAKEEAVRMEEAAVRRAVRREKYDKEAAVELIKTLKLREVIASPAYKMWQVSLLIEQGLRMVEQGKQILAREDAIARESGVSNLAIRRPAGEQIVEGKTLVEQAFATYKQLGGKESKPEDVKAGADPASGFR